MKARDVMTRGVVSVTPDCTIKELAKRMQQYRISGLPVINAGGALVGMVTEADCQRRAETGRIAAVLDLSGVLSELAPHYSPIGRPSIDPVLMIRTLVLG
jgi:CBS domain-containing protein